MTSRSSRLVSRGKHGSVRRVAGLFDRAALFIGLVQGRATVAGVAASWSIALTLLCLSAAQVSAQPANRVLLFGSSSVNGSFGRVIVNEFAQRGISVVRRGFSAAGLARPDFRDLRETISTIPLERMTRTVVFYIGGNDAQGIWLRPEERKGDTPRDKWIWWNDDNWSAFYENRAVKFFQSICARGQRIVVLPPADVRSARLQSRLDRVRHLLKRATQATTCGRFVPTAGDWKYLELAGEPLRTPDGVHMTLAGAMRVWNRVRDAVLGFARGA
jgi:hypothetical protein